MLGPPSCLKEVSLVSIVSLIAFDISLLQGDLL